MRKPTFDFRANLQYTDHTPKGLTRKQREDLAMSDTIQRLRRQLAEAEENLLLIQERKSEYVQATDTVQR